MKNISLLLFLAIAMLACTSTKEGEKENSKAPSDVPENNSIELSKAQVRMAGIRWDSLRIQSFDKEIHVTGTFALPPSAKATASAYFGGYVTDIQLIEGQRVRKGQVLFRLENPEYLRLQQSFLEAKSRLRHLKASYERQEKLLQDQAVSEKELSAAQMEYEVVTAQYESLKQQLRLMKLNPETLRPENMRRSINITAPISGFVSGVQIAKGQYVSPTDAAVSIMDTRHLHLELSVFEKYYTQIESGQSLRFFLPDRPEKQYKAEIYLPARSIDIEARSGMVHAHLLEGQDAGFTSGMYAEAYIKLQGKQLLALPKSAVFEEDGEFFAWMKVNQSQGKTILKKQKITIARSNEQFVAVGNYQELPANAFFIVEGGLQLSRES